MVDERAPVVASAEGVIGASPEVVWRLLTEFERWPAWNPDVKQVSVSGPLAVGTEFRWKAGPGTITSRVREVDAPRRISWSGRTMGIRALHDWELEPADGVTRVRTAESWDGLLPWLLRWPLRRMLQGSLESGLRYLKAAAQGGAETA